jgi:glycosyltransferase involved in cell wall biosynthesis
MKAIFVHDARYIRKKGEIYTELEFSYDSWKPYLELFDEICVIGRAYHPDPAVFMQAENYNRCSGPHVTFSLYPRLTTFKNMILAKRRVWRGILKDCAGADAVILRGIQENAWLAFLAARKLGKPVALEATGCMWNNTWHYGSLLGKLYAPIRYRRAREVFAKADGVLYVTQKFLQSRYPAKGLAVSASDVKLAPPEKTVLETRLERIRNTGAGHVWKIGLIGPLDHQHKGIDTALKALKQWQQRTGQAFHLHLLGRGRTSKIKQLARRLGIADKISYDGVMPHERVAAWLGDLDLYLQPSRTEGLPRATLEAMAQALPVIASNAGDLPAILDPAFIHPRGDAAKLSKMIETMLGDPAIMAAQASQNFETIETRFHPDILRQKRGEFWQKFLEIVRERAASRHSRSR